MKDQIYLTDPTQFRGLRSRADKTLLTLRRAPRDEIVYFDTAIVTTAIFFRFVRALFEFTRSPSDSFSFIGLRPDPVEYFFHHFKKYPALILEPTDSEADYCAMLQTDPGDSLADALAFNCWAYALMPRTGGWICYGNESTEIAAFYGTKEENQFARTYLARDIVRPGPDFKLID